MAPLLPLAWRNLQAQATGDVLELPRTGAHVTLADLLRSVPFWFWLGLLAVQDDAHIAAHLMGSAESPSVMQRRVGWERMMET
jgi:hypothetical protein